MPADTRPPEEAIYPGVDEPTPTTPLKVYSYEELEKLPPPVFLLDDWIPDRSVGFIAGSPASGKSLLALDWALTIAHGWKWYGHQSRQRSVLYLTDEGRNSFGARIQAWLKTRNAASPGHQLGMVFDHLKLGGDPSVTYADQERITSLCEERRVGLLVIDPMADYFSGSAKDEQNAINLTSWCQSMAETGMVVLINHHTAKVPSARGGGYILRDSSALAGAADWVYHMDVKEHDGRGNKQGVEYTTLRYSKGKDLEPTNIMQFNIEQVEVPMAIRRHDNEIGTSVVLRYRGVAAQEDGLKQRIIETLMDGAMTGSELEMAVVGNASKIREVRDELAAEGAIKNIGTPGRPRWVAGDAPENL